MEMVMKKRGARTLSLAITGLCAFLVLGVPPINAANVQFNFGGSVAEVHGGVFTAGGTGSNGFGSSLPLSGSFTYNSANPDLLPGDPMWGLYANPVQSMNLKIGNYTATFSPGSSVMQVINNPGLGDTFKLTLTDFIVKAWALALVRVPSANAVWAGDRILRFARADIAVAVALEGGLITPVVREADTRPLSALAAELRDLPARARARKLRPEDYQGGSSAVSNLGMHGVRDFAAIVNPPHATILAVGAARRAPRETEDGGIAFASEMTVTLSCDHRAVDGTLGAELLATFKRLIENPVTMMV